MVGGSVKNYMDVVRQKIMALYPKIFAMKTYLITFMFFFVPIIACGQPNYLPGDGWDEKFAPTLYVNNGDSAWVYPDDYRRLKYNGNWLYGCTNTGNFDLISVTDSVASVGSKIVEEGRAVEISNTETRVQCLFDFRGIIDSLSAGIGGQDPNFTYSKCRTNVDNATVHIPDEASGTKNLTEGDTIAVYNNGECVGSGVWEQQGITLAAAGKGGFDWGWFDGMLEEGDKIKYEFYIVEDDLAYRPLDVQYTSCENVNVPSDICRDDGKYSEDTFLKVSSISFGV